MSNILELYLPAGIYYMPCSFTSWYIVSCYLYYWTALFWQPHQNSNQRDHEEGPRRNLAPSRLPIQVHMTEIELEPSMREKGQKERLVKNNRSVAHGPRQRAIDKHRQACWAVSHANSTKMVQCKQNSLITEAVAKPGQVRPRQLQLQRQRIKGA